jgi:rsbT co-antagonist protein RsbR
MAAPSVLATILQRDEPTILREWIDAQLATISRAGAVKDGELRQQCADFLRLLRDAVGSGGETEGSEFAPVRDLLGEVSRARSALGFTPSETATFVFSLKKPLFARIRTELARDAGALAQETWRTSEILDQLGLYTTELYQKAREAVIARQQEEMLELSTPVVKLWDGIVALPMIGTLDSNRTQVVMETLLQKIVETGSQVAIIDITGVPTVDTLVAQHLLKTVAAARLMGADCIISGIRPQIAQTIVHLGIELGDVTTKANLADAFEAALQRTGAEMHRPARRSGA